MDIQEQTKSFFSSKDLNGKPLLVGFSGGEDSLCLTMILKKLSLPFHLAHFDHGWREESAEEAKALEKFAKEMGVVFHTKRGISNSRKEDDARVERYRFFDELMSTGNFRALVLAHHNLDLGETVLKRVLEGAQLTSLRSMQATMVRGDWELWRPLLGVSKKTIRNYISEKKLKAIEDKTNTSQNYLRGRMRTTLFPFLEETFGKNIVAPLVQISDESQALNEYMERRVAECPVYKGPFGACWDLSTFDPYEVQYLVRREVLTTREHAKQIVSAIVDQKVNIDLSTGETALIVDRQKLFLLERPIPTFPTNVPISEGAIVSEAWKWKWQMVKERRSDWLDIWKGKYLMSLPEGANRFISLDASLRKKLQNQRVPAFLRAALFGIEGETKETWKEVGLLKKATTQKKVLEISLTRLSQ